MGGVGSGRRSAPKAYDIVLPELGDTEESCRAFCRAVALAVKDGGLDPRAADTLVATAREVRQSIGQEKDRLVMKELAQLRDDAKAIVTAGEKHADAARRHMDDRDVQDAEESDGEELPTKI